MQWKAKLPRNITTRAMGLLGILLTLAVAVGEAAAQSVGVTVTPRLGATLTVGSTYGWKATFTNASGSTISFNQKYVATAPDGISRFQVQGISIPATLNPGGSLWRAEATTTSVFSPQTGTWTFEAQAVDTVTGNILGTGSASFTILPLPPSVVPPRFTDLTAAAGVAAIHNNDATVCMAMIGTGAGWADYDGDGLLDLYVSDHGAVGTGHLYRNKGNLIFEEVTAAAGIPNFPHQTGVSWADYDNDGHPDLLVLTSFGGPHLFHNNGNGTFTEATATAGLSDASQRGTTAAWVDFDNDGWLDLFIGQRDACEPVTASSMLFRNKGDGTFTNVTKYLGAGVIDPALFGLTFGVVAFDYNNDNRPDIYVVNDKGGRFHSNVLWRNDGPDGAGGWKFTDVATAGADIKMAAMGVGIGDYNRDGCLDFAVSDILRIALGRNNCDGTFTNVARDTGAHRKEVNTTSGNFRQSITWGIEFADVNNDGWEDIIAAGGEISQSELQPNALLVNNVDGHLSGMAGDGVFLDLTYASGSLNDKRVARTVAVADFDADGWLDAIIINHFGKPPLLLRNEGPADGNTNHWLQVRLVGAGAPMSNRDGIGAKLKLIAGGETQYRQIISGSSLGAGSQVPAHFGLAANTTVDSLEVRWPSGLVQTFTGLTANQRLVVTEGSAVIGYDPTPARLPSP